MTYACFLMSEAPLYGRNDTEFIETFGADPGLVHRNPDFRSAPSSRVPAIGVPRSTTPTPLGPPQNPTHRPTVGLCLVNGVGVWVRKRARGERGRRETKRGKTGYKPLAFLAFHPPHALDYVVGTAFMETFGADPGLVHRNPDFRSAPSSFSISNVVLIKWFL